MDAIRLLVVDDHPLLRAGFRAFCEPLADVELIGETDDGVEAVRLARELRPDVLVLDACLPDSDGADVVRQVRQAAPGTRILIYTGYADERLARTFLRLGVDGYVVKGTRLSELMTTVRRVYRGERCVDRAIAQRLREGEASVVNETLSAREIEVLRLVAEGKPDAATARTLQISIHTVHTHVKHLLTKLDAANRTELAYRALDEGWTSR